MVEVTMFLQYKDFLVFFLCVCVCDCRLANFVGEGAVDYGGPCREFFLLLLLRLADDNSQHYHGVEGKNYFCATCLHTRFDNKLNLVRHVLMVINA